ncbi:ATP-binding cassette domain-containing protein [Mesorhizobium sp. NZP2298]|uniref:ATP-binding cassette domain-containing protein n=1 Tax=Mesorhizobium sp. NZP2298 TaxID=2483403 RepID=UPI001556DB10|nr:ATP-binding cassette domain-containing protein [Mesorhizobium sp. NZP2298]QKC98226.1 sugar ABC transporter ATP-binding protein [Mesorhizobium sp. NZP2298]
MVSPILEARDVYKSYGHVRSLQGASLELYPAEIVALIGDNGAGKSTLTRALSGVTRIDRGEILIDGQPITFQSPQDAREHGIETVYQDLALAVDLSPAENIYLGREIPRAGILGKLGFMDRRAMLGETERRFKDLGVNLKDIRGAVANLSGGQRQGVAVARALIWAKRVVFMDEPTAALGVAQTRNVLSLIQRVRDQGVSVVLISHSMPDVLAVSDRIVVLRHGATVAQFNRGEAKSDDLVAAMTGSLQMEGLAQ